MEDAALQSHPRTAPSDLARQYLLWADGAGVFLVCLKEEVTIGGLRDDPDRADVCVMSNLSRRHATISRAGGTYRILPHASVTMGDSLLPANTGEGFPLRDGAEMVLDEGVEIVFRQPSVLSLTATLEFRSSHRPLTGQPPVAFDHVVLMDQNCLLGPGGDRHIRLEDCETDLILYRSKGQLWCKSETPFSLNDDYREPFTKNTRNSPLASGDVVTGKDFRFRLEALAND